MLHGATGQTEQEFNTYQRCLWAERATLLLLKGKTLEWKLRESLVCHRSRRMYFGFIEMSLYSSHRIYIWEVLNRLQYIFGGNVLGEILPKVLERNLLNLPKGKVNRR